MKWQDYCLLFVAAANVFAIVQRFMQWYEARKQRRKSDQ